MLNSQYLSVSRHGVYYFRFNIPQSLHPERKQTTEYYDVMGTDAQLATVIDAYALPIKRDSKDYNTLRNEYLRAYRDYCTAALEQDKKLESYEFGALPIARPTLPKSKSKKLAAMVESYCNDHLSNGLVAGSVKVWGRALNMTSV